MMSLIGLPLGMQDFLVNWALTAAATAQSGIRWGIAPGKGHCHSSAAVRKHHNQIQEIGTSAFQAVAPTVLLNVHPGKTMPLDVLGKDVSA